MRIRDLVLTLGAAAIVYRVLSLVQIDSHAQRHSLQIDIEGEPEDLSEIQNDLIDDLISMDEDEREEFVDVLAEKLDDKTFDNLELNSGKNQKESVKNEKSKDLQKPEKSKKLGNQKLDLNEREERILSLFDKKSEIDTDYLESRINGVSVRTLRRDLDKLAESGLLKKIGKTKGSYYVRAK